MEDTRGSPRHRGIDEVSLVESWGHSERDTMSSTLVPSLHSFDVSAL